MITNSVIADAITDTERLQQALAYIASIKRKAVSRAERDPAMEEFVELATQAETIVTAVIRGE